ncbi:MAG: putative DNA binding protein, CopG/RHH family [Candidatus Electronema aureum]|uniref:DNA binding protein, CopG/RHH family n=1 Tax=Candidatus Electronema aureum TaxID=2005002 RepID=A0A521G424_9BACT|nr:MAG: putative DNA binding protein, CopG/RHH family [Candidatus Electronema aureum]
MNDKLDSYEQEILAAFEQGKLKSVPNVEAELAAAREAAANTLAQRRQVDICLTEQDFDLASIRAVEDGIPCQTLLASIIHKYLSGRLVERRLQRRIV